MKFFLLVTFSLALFAQTFCAEDVSVEENAVAVNERQSGSGGLGGIWSPVNGWPPVSGWPTVNVWPPGTGTQPMPNLQTYLPIITLYISLYLTANGVESGTVQYLVNRITSLLSQYTTMPIPNIISQITTLLQQYAPSVTNEIVNLIQTILNQLTSTTYPPPPPNTDMCSAWYPGQSQSQNCGLCSLLWNLLKPCNLTVFQLQPIIQQLITLINAQANIQTIINYLQPALINCNVPAMTIQQWIIPSLTSLLQSILGTGQNSGGLLGGPGGLLNSILSLVASLLQSLGLGSSTGLLSGLVSTVGNLLKGLLGGNGGLLGGSGGGFLNGLLGGNGGLLGGSGGGFLNGLLGGITGGAGGVSPPVVSPTVGSTGGFLGGLLGGLLGG